MTHKILYAEIQPCVLATCECKSDEPFLMMFRAMNQVIACGHCAQQYGIAYDGKDVQVVTLPAATKKTAVRAN